MGQTVKMPASHESPVWLDCKKLTKNEIWIPKSDESADYVRTISWADEDSSKQSLHKLTELGVKKLLRSPRPWIFHMTRLEADAETGKFSQYFIAREGLFNVMHSLILMPRDGEDIVEYAERTDGEIKGSQQFIVENGFLAPNMEDRIELLDILDQALAINGTALSSGIRHKSW